jgi:drug/metabolite transporter (DMT)-like permease
VRSRLSRINPFFRAVGFIMVAMFLFDVMGAIIKYMGASYPPQQLATFRNLFGLIPSLIVLFLASDWHAAGRPLIIRQWKIGLVRGGFAAVAQFCYYLSLVHLELATATTLSFAGPLFVTTLSVPILKNHVGIWRWMAVGIGFVGIVLILRPGSEIFTPYALLPIGAAIGYACASVSVRLIDTEVPVATINLYSIVGALAVSVLVLFSTTGYVAIASLHDWLWLVAMGAVGGCAVLCMITGYRLTQPSNIAPFEYFGIPFSFLLGWYFFGETPFGTLLPGALFIVAGGLLIVWRERQGAI